MVGLEDQLLGKLILKEKSELESQRQQLLSEVWRVSSRLWQLIASTPTFLKLSIFRSTLHCLQVQSYKSKIKQLEDDLLFRLSNSQGNLLDDKELVDILAVTKQTAQVRMCRWRSRGLGDACSMETPWEVVHLHALQKSALSPPARPPPREQEVNERLVTASETRRKINEACEEYRPVARRATLLYFLIAEFAGVNCMYQVGWCGAATMPILLACRFPCSAGTAS